jgi:anti-sigma factor RsiW
VNHDEASALLGAYALDAVSEEEAALIAAHVAECPQCTAELAEHREVAGMLGNMGGDAPRELWDRIASQATRPVGAPDRTPPIVVPTSLATERRHRRQGARRSPWAVAIALTTVAAVTIALMAVQISHLNTRVAHLSSMYSHQGLLLAEQAALLQPSTKRVGLVDASGTTQQAELVLARSGPSFFVNDQLATLPASKTYQLWAVTAGKPVSLGLLGQTPTLVAFTVNAARPPTTFAVTVERAAGVAAPTSNAVAVSPTKV